MTLPVLAFLPLFLTLPYTELRNNETVCRLAGKGIGYCLEL